MLPAATYLWVLGFPRLPSAQVGLGLLRMLQGRKESSLRLVFA